MLEDKKGEVRATLTHRLVLYPGFERMTSCVSNESYSAPRQVTQITGHTKHGAQNTQAAKQSLSCIQDPVCRHLKVGEAAMMCSEQLMQPNPPQVVGSAAHCVDNDGTQASCLLLLVNSERLASSSAWM